MATSNKVTLYGKDKSGSNKIWSIETGNDKLIISHGKYGAGFKITVKEEIVKGKNIGRSNETTGKEQAEFEMQSRINKQIDKGYRHSIDELEELPLLPMLAHDYNKQGHRIEWPCWGSPKMDGVRCLAIAKNGSVTLKSRGGKEYDVKHIQEQLKAVMNDGDVWDGELYIHGKYLEEIISLVKKPKPESQNLTFVVFDIIKDKDFDERVSEMQALDLNQPHLSVIDYYFLESEDHMKFFHKFFVDGGFEGIMLRNLDGRFESGKRSSDLQKYKEFFDSEFKIVGVSKDKNGNGVLEVFCEIAQATFTVCLGTFADRQRQLDKPWEFVGKWLTVKYQNRYKDSKLPQFPTGVCVRDCDINGNPVI